MTVLLGLLWQVRRLRLSLRKAVVAESIMRTSNRVLWLCDKWKLLRLRRIRPGYARRFASQYCRDRWRWGGDHHQTPAHERHCDRGGRHVPFLYELQGAIYLNCTVSERLSSKNPGPEIPRVMSRQTPRTFASKALAKRGGQAIQSHNSTWLTETRVEFSGVKGHPPLPATTLAICYRAGYQSRILVNATGYRTEKK